MSLALKYRPQKLADLLGQEQIKATLQNAITTTKIAPAYLFTGSRGTGKTSTARILAKSLNCTSSTAPTVNPCGTCYNCKSIETGNSLDVAEIDAASHNGVEDARILVEQSHFRPVKSRYKVFILDESHCLSTQAFNALLKCLEEPPKQVVFILCTTETHKIMPTIASRCQIFNFKTFTTTEIASRLNAIASAEQIDLKPQAALSISRAANGGMRDALQLLDQLQLSGTEITPASIAELSGRTETNKLVELLRHIQKSNTLELLLLARDLLDRGQSPQAIISDLIEVYRDLLITIAVPEPQELTASNIPLEQLRSFSVNWNYNDTLKAFEQLRLSESQLKSSINPYLWLETCLLGLAIANPPTVESEINAPEVWEKTLANATDKTRNLLSSAELIRVTQTEGTLAIPLARLDWFTRNLTKIEDLINSHAELNLKLRLTAKESAVE